MTPTERGHPSEGSAPGAPARRATWRDPIVRNGHILTISSGATAAIGLLYWSIATRLYSTTVVGQSSAVLSAMMLLGGLAQLNLMSAILRFVPVAGPHARRLVLGCYGVGVCVGALLGTGFVLVASHVSHEFNFVTRSPLLTVGFVMSVSAWTVFVLQDSVLTGLRRTAWVLGENATFSMLKVGFLVVAASAIPAAGILVSWWAGIGLAILVTNWYLFCHPLAGRLDEPKGSAAERLGIREIARFAAPDYLGALCWIVATNAAPILIIAENGAASTAYFAVSWQIALALFTLSANMGQSLVVETAADQSNLASRWVQVVRHSLLLLTGAAAAISLLAPEVLSIFGSDYRSHATSLLRLLVWSAVPNLITATAVSALRSQRRTAAAAALLGVLCAGVIVLTVGLLPVIGISAVGVAWLVTETGVSVVLLVNKERWLPHDSAPADTEPSEPGEGVHVVVHPDAPAVARVLASRLQATLITDVDEAERAVAERLAGRGETSRPASSRPLDRIRRATQAQTRAKLAALLPDLGPAEIDALASAAPAVRAARRLEVQGKMAARSAAPSPVVRPLVLLDPFAELGARRRAALRRALDQIAGPELVIVVVSRRGDVAAPDDDQHLPAGVG